MTHYRIQQWKAYAQGGGVDRTSMDAHLLECEDCMELYVVSLEEVREDLPQISDITHFTERVLEQIQFLPKHRIKRLDHRRWYSNTLFHYTIAASLTLVLVGSGTFNQMIDRVSQISQDTEQVHQISVSDQLTNKAGKWLDAIPTKKKEGKP
jgi:predicted anti-sigma-YlaC factor YlaD